VAKSRTSLGTGSLSGRFIESLFRLKNPNQSLLMAQNSGSLAMLAAMRRASSRGGTLRLDFVIVLLGTRP
jgi:hypothetical protein